MAILKLSSSGKQLQLVLSEDLPAGSILACGVGSLRMLEHGNIKFSRLSILPFAVSPDRFPKSEVWGSDDLQVKLYAEKLNSFNVNNDSLSGKFTKERKQKKTYTSKKVVL